MERLLIHGAAIIDGTGEPRFQGDVAVDGEWITEIGSRIDSAGRKVIDASGLVVAPGFIDLHTHTDRKIFDNPLGDSKVMQGVTTEVTCNCGIGPFPVEPERVNELESYLNILNGSLPADGISWRDFDGFAAEVDKVRPGINLAMLVSHGALRIAAVGLADRTPTPKELTKMATLLEVSLQQGAWGMSTGLIYPPGSFSSTDELVALAKILAKYNTLYTTHIRGESTTLLNSIEEAISIGKESGARVTVSHLKAIGKPYWGQGLAALNRIEAARRQGIDVWADQYPYEATSTSLSALVPGWAQDGGVEQLLQRLADPKLKAVLAAAVLTEMNIRGGPERVKIAGLKLEKNQEWVGKTIKDLADARRLPAEDVVCQLLLEENGAVSAVYFSLGQDDLKGILKNPNVAVASDGQAMNPERDGNESVHPRSYGTFPRVLGKYVRDKGLLTLETAIRKMTSLPATMLRMTDRGLVRPGLRADLVVFDPATVLDKADFSSPHQYPIGIPYVLVNGSVAVKASRLTGDGRGYVLRKPR